MSPSVLLSACLRGCPNHDLSPVPEESQWGLYPLLSPGGTLSWVCQAAEPEIWRNLFSGFRESFLSYQDCPHQPGDRANTGDGQAGRTWSILTCGATELTNSGHPPTLSPLVMGENTFSCYWSLPETGFSTSCKLGILIDTEVAWAGLEIPLSLFSEMELGQKWYWDPTKFALGHQSTSFLV